MQNEVINTLKSFDFNDGQIVEVHHCDPNVVLRFRNWQETLFRMVFKGVVGIEGFEFPNIDGVSIKTESPLIKKCIESIELSKGTAAGYSNYQFVHLEICGDGHPYSIVFLDLEIAKEA